MTDNPSGVSRRDALQAMALAPFAVTFGATFGARPRAQDTARSRPGLVELAERLKPLSRGDAFRVVAELRRAGSTPREVLGAIFLAGVEEVRPRPVGFKLHAVMMVAPAFDLVRQTPPDADRTESWLPAFWNLADLKRSQAADKLEGDWSLPPRPEPAAGDPAAALAKAFAAGDEALADRACVALARATTQRQAFETIWPVAASNYHNLGHMIIHAVQSERALAEIGWLHGESVLRALAHALLTPGDERALQDAPRSRALAAGFRAGWQTGAADAKAALALLPELRVLDHESAPKHVAAAIDRGASASTVWDALRLWAFEQLARRPGILAVHAVTSVNAFGFAARATQDEATRRLLLLQSAAWLGHYRHDVGVGDDGLELDRLEPHATATSAADLFAGAERELAPARALRLGQDAAGREAFVGEARRLLFRKAREHHDWKFAAAAFEEAGRAHPELAPRLLAASTAYLRRAGDADSADSRYAVEVMGG